MKLTTEIRNGRELDWAKRVKRSIARGVTFSTPFETGCIALERPSPITGEFIGIDSEGEECKFSVAMVTEFEGRPQ